ncbi:MAG: tRNA (guanosine(37)-N1)-methyltransferase TrmD [Nevskiales bacterium]
MKIAVVSLFPEFVEQVGQWGVTGRALKRGLLSLEVLNPREFAQDRHRTVDDRVYGGGPGMVMQSPVLSAALSAARQVAGAEAKLAYLSPQGEPLTQDLARRFAQLPGLVLLCGRYEGVDERLIETEVDFELSIGDYILSGGELAAMVVIDTIARLLPGALNDAESAAQESFTDGLLDHPQYTRPENWAGRPVPEVLLSGDHAAIARWRMKQALGRTWLKRPELLEGLGLNAEQQTLLREWIEEQG